MEHHGWDNPAVTVALALAMGMVSQIFARHLRVPGIVLLLGAGVALGPDGIGIVHPEGLGSGMGVLVGFAVAIILFEGGLQLDFRRLRREAGVIRRMVTLGAAITAVGATVMAKLIMGWPWSTAALFGTLVIVTGPTVITPLLRRIRVQHRVGTVLEAEGVFGDAIGAILAVVALEVVLGQEGAMGSAGTLVWQTISRLGFGLIFGGATGYLLVLILRIPRGVPEELLNTFTLAMAVAIFQISNVIRPESGVLSVIIAGMVVGNARNLALEEVKEFKEQLTTLLIGMLFVLLAADVRLSAIADLGLAGVATVAALILVVRPLAVMASTRGTELTRNERVFLMWLAPRGIVAAAVASLFAVSLKRAGVEGGESLQALVFLVIGSTVILLGLPAGLVAGLLGLRRASGQGVVILGANSLARVMANGLREAGDQVVLIDSNADACAAAEAEGFRVLYGSGMSDRVQLAADLSGRRAVMATVPNDAVSLLFARHARKVHKLEKVWTAIREAKGNMSTDQLEHEGLHVLFGGPREIDRWIDRLDQRLVKSERWQLPAANANAAQPLSLSQSKVLPVLYQRGKVTAPVDAHYSPKKGDVLWALLESDGAEALSAAGWRAVEAEAEVSA
ncbi:MAG: cation:proton antiporter [Bradymonadia bacterium]